MQGLLTLVNCLALLDDREHRGDHRHYRQHRHPRDRGRSQPAKPLPLP